MREIKFRGKRIDGREWVYGLVTYDRLTPSALRIDTKDGCIYEVDPATVGQYIPKEGFYEGDVLCGKETDEYGTMCSEWYGTVKYDDITGRIRIKDDCGDWYETNDFEYDEIIGNIHDIPELMEVAQ